MRVMLIKGRSAYDALRIFTDGLAEAFAARGYQPVVLDVPAEPDLAAALRREAAVGPITLVHSFTLLGEWRDGEGRTVGEITGAPHVIQFVDYPFTHMQRLDGCTRAAAILTIDESHVEAINSVYGADHFAHVGFCPHAAIGQPAPREADAGAFADARDIPILFCGTFYKPDTPPWAAQEARIRRIFEGAVELALAAEWMPALEALDQSMADAGLNPADPSLASFRKNATFVHEHVRAFRRFELLKAAAKAGLPLHVYGKGFEKHLYRFKSFIHGGEADLNQAIALMRRSRVVLNINANFGRGSHERPLTALMAGAAPATDHSAFYAARFSPEKEVLLYRWKALDEGMARVAALSADCEAAFAMAGAGQARVLAEHTWAQRIDVILAAADAARARLMQAA